MVLPAGAAVDPAGSILRANGHAASGNGAVFAINPLTGAQTVLASGGNYVNVREPASLGLLALGLLALGGLALLASRR